MTTFLLDANVLIALTAREHVHHERASRWADAIERFAVCPIVEGALIRFAVRLGATNAEALGVLKMVKERPGYEFWSDDVSYTDAGLGHVYGHRQVTDAYLVSLVRSKSDALLATLDEGLARAAPELTELIPEI